MLTLFYLMQNVGSIGFSSHHLNGLQKACVAAAKIYKVMLLVIALMYGGCALASKAV